MLTVCKNRDGKSGSIFMTAFCTCAPHSHPHTPSHASHSPHPHTPSHASHSPHPHTPSHASHPHPCTLYYHLPPTHTPTQGEEDESADLKVRDDGTTLEQLIVSQTNSTKLYSLVAWLTCTEGSMLRSVLLALLLKHQIPLVADHAHILQ